MSGEDFLSLMSTDEILSDKVLLKHLEHRLRDVERQLVYYRRAARRRSKIIKRLKAKV